ncbi:MAG TPA: PDZ domain-containing protein [Methylomirabilota bacterium]
MKPLVVLVALLLLVPVGPVDAASKGWGWLGVRIRDLSEQEVEEISQKHGLREGFGVVIVEVMKETPAEASGLKNGDLVVAFRERPVVDTRTLQRLVASTSVGETVPLTVLRRDDAGRRRVIVRVGLMPDTVAADRIAAEFGFLVRDPDAPGDGGAALLSDGPPTVAAVMSRSSAEEAGLEVGDVLVEVNGRAVLTLAAAREALLGSSLERPLPLVVKRDSERLALTLKSPGGMQ